MAVRRTGTALRVVCGLAIALAAGPAPAAPEPAWVGGEIKLNYRAGPTATSVPLGIVETGQRVTVLERKDGWARVEVAGGAAGWLAESYLDDAPPPTQRLVDLETQVASAHEELVAARSELERLAARSSELDAAGAQREAELRGLAEENQVLRAGERWPYMLMGAAILGAGMLVGALIGGRSSRRLSSRIRF
jgi:hypothetical protein